MNSEETYDQRAERRRRTWTARLGREEMAAQATETTVAERVAHVRWVCEAAWAFAGRDLPVYSRAEMPGRVFRDEPR